MRSAPEHFETDIGTRFTQPYRDHPSPLNHSFANETCRTASSATLPPLLNADLDRLPLALRAYASFHASAIACLAEAGGGAADDSDGSVDKKEDEEERRRRKRRGWWGGRQRRKGCNERLRLLVWRGELGFIGGFGDRWKGLQFVLALAIATRSVFLLEWPHQAQTPYDLSAALHPTYIDWRLQPFIVKAISAVKDDQQITVQLLRDPDGTAIGRPYSFSNPFASRQQEQRLEANVSDFNAALAPYDVVFVRNTFLAGDDIVRLAKNQHHTWRFDGLTHLDYIPMQRVLTRFMFRPSPAVAFLARQRSFPHGLPYVGVHMRTGIDVLETSDQRFRQVSDVAVHDTLISTVLSCIRRHAGTYMVGGSGGRRNSNNKMRLFVASDSKMLKQRFVEYAQRNGHDNEVIIVNTNLRFVWHMDRQRSDLFDNYDEHCLAFLDIFADAYALSEAVSIVYLPSNFPEAAVGFGNVKAWHKLQGNGLTPLDEQECFPSNLSTIAS